MNANPKDQQTGPFGQRPPGGPQRHEPIFAGPTFPLMIALVLVVCHWLYTSASPAGQDVFFVNGALIPQLWMDTDLQISSPLIPWFSLIGHGALHASWGHVIMNATGLVAFGAATAARLGAFRFLMVFLSGVVGGGVVYLIYALAVDGMSAAAVVGASGGVSALLGAASMVEPRGRTTHLRSFRDRGVWGTALLFAFIHIPLVLLDEPLLGASIAWQAHIGGYVIGLVVFWFIVPRDRAIRR